MYRALFGINISHTQSFQNLPPYFTKLLKPHELSRLKVRYAIIQKHFNQFKDIAKSQRNLSEHIKTLSPKKDQTPFNVSVRLLPCRKKKVRLKRRGS